MTTDSVWMIEKKISGEWVLSPGLLPSADEAEAEFRIKVMSAVHGGNYRAVEYRRVKEGE